MVKFYMAQVASFVAIGPAIYSLINEYGLLTYYDERTYVDEMCNNYEHVMVDSGAFSMATRNVKIDIDEYVNFLSVHGHKFDAYANLDVIGNADETLKNQRYLESKGLSPLPVFHQGEDLKYLDDYVKSYDYIGLGGMVGGKSGNRWLDDIFTKYPDHKFHGFGIGSLNIIERYPFYSVDSTSWLRDSGMGMLNFKSLSSCHYNELTDLHKSIVNEMGFSESLLKTKHLTRHLFNLLLFRSKLSGYNKKYEQLHYNDITEEFI